jgi:hypothetical protein
MLALVAGLFVAGLSLAPQSASAAPVIPAPIAATAPVEKAQFGFYVGPGPGYYAPPRRYYGGPRYSRRAYYGRPVYGRPYYAPRRYYDRPRYGRGYGYGRRYYRGY